MNDTVTPLGIITGPEINDKRMAFRMVILGLFRATENFTSLKVILCCVIFRKGQIFLDPLLLLGFSPGSRISKCEPHRSRRDMKDCSTVHKLTSIFLKIPTGCLALKYSSLIWKGETSVCSNSKQRHVTG